MMSIKEALSILEVSSIGLTLDSLKQAYRIKARNSHPDTGGKTDEFIRVRQAYMLLRSVLLRGGGFNDTTGKYTYSQSNSEKGESSIDWYQKWREYQTEVERLYIQQSELWRIVQQYEEQITTMIKIFNDGQQRIGREQEVMQARAKVLDNMFREELSQLKKRHTLSFWDIVFGRKKLTRTEYIQLHNDLVRQFNELEQRELLDYNNRIKSIYQDIMNQMYTLLSQ